MGQDMCINDVAGQFAHVRLYRVIDCELDIAEELADSLFEMTVRDCAADRSEFVDLLDGKLISREFSSSETADFICVHLLAFECADCDEQYVRGFVTNERDSTVALEKWMMQDQTSATKGVLS